MSDNLTLNIQFPDEEQFGDIVHKYEVTGEHGELFTVDNRVLFDLRSNTTNEQNLLDFNQHVGTLESLVSFYSEMKTKARQALDDYVEESYFTYKSMSKKKLYGRALGPTEDHKEPTDKVVAAKIKSTDEYRELRDGYYLISTIVDRLERSLKIAANSWETARSLNSNSRKLFGVGT